MRVDSTIQIKNNIKRYLENLWPVMKLNGFLNLYEKPNRISFQ